MLVDGASLIYLSPTPPYLHKTALLKPGIIRGVYCNYFLKTFYYETEFPISARRGMFCYFIIIYAHLFVYDLDEKSLVRRRV